jgi:glutamyl-tRNA synthetase
MPCTRLAPSPTGALHLGNVRTFLVNWAMARQRGWRIVLRIEDLDGPRVKPDAATEAINVLRWLGLDWDEGPYTQRTDLEPYEAALARLDAQGDLYPCRCTRREIEAAALSAPHGDEHEIRYLGTCRGNDSGDRVGAALRIVVPVGPTEFVDEFVGRHGCDVQATIGDFLVATKDGLPSYQLAVVVDDARQGVDRIVRGDDLLGSTHRQLLLQRRLGIDDRIEYFHLPLVVGQDGRRLAKRHGDTRASRYRNAGVAAERLIGLVAEWCGLGHRTRMGSDEFAGRFQLEALPRTPIVFTPADDAWLLQSDA